MSDPGPQGACEKAKFKVALDIGHDTVRSGATSASGHTEFQYNLLLGQKVRQALQAAGFVTALLIGDNGIPMPLSRRPEIAREQGAAIFISLHHDSAQKRYFSQWEIKGVMRPYSDTFRGYSIFVSKKSSLEKDSMTLATLLARALLAQGRTPSAHHAEKIPGEGRTLLDPVLGIYQFDELAVLRGATVPALLLESAVIVNRAEEQEILSGATHTRIKAALVSAITQYCASHPSALGSHAE